MRINQYLSIKEHKFLFYFFIFGLLLRVVELLHFHFFTEHSPQDKNSNILYSIFNELGIMSRIYSFFVFLVCILLIWKFSFIKVLATTFFSSLLAYFFDSWFYTSLSRLYFYFNSNLPNMTLIDATFETYYNFITFLLINFLVLWQISILFRMLMRTNSRNEILP